MKVALTALSLIAIIVAAAVIAETDRNAGVSKAPPVGALPVPTIAVNPTVELPPALTVSRDAAIEWGRMRAATFGENAPVLMDADLAPLREIKQRLLPDGASAGDGPTRGPWVDAEDLLMWLVRMRGSFVAPHGPVEIVEETGKEVPMVPVDGWMFTVIDARTGETMVSGFQPV